MKTGIKVSDIMTRKLVAVKPDASLKECVKKMFDEGTGSIVVVEKDSLLGFITKRDILKWVLEEKEFKDFSKIKAEDAMMCKAKTISPDKDLYEALALMKRTKIKKMPVVRGDEVVGLLTMKDILKVEPQLFDFIAESLHVKEESEKLRRREEARTKKEDVEGEGVEGPCEGCGNFDILQDVDGKLVCGSCRDH